MTTLMTGEVEAKLNEKVKEFYDAGVALLRFMREDGRCIRCGGFLARCSCPDGAGVLYPKLEALMGPTATEEVELKGKSMRGDT